MELPIVGAFVEPNGADPDVTREDIPVDVNNPPTTLTNGPDGINLDPLTDKYISISIQYPVSLFWSLLTVFDGATCYDFWWFSNWEVHYWHTVMSFEKWFEIGRCGFNNYWIKLDWTSNKLVQARLKHEAWPRYPIRPQLWGEGDHIHNGGGGGGVGGGGGGGGGGVLNGGQGSEERNKV